MSLFRTALPYLLVGYFLWRARTQRVFVLGIPFLMFMGASLFFDDAKLFYTPGSWDRNLHLFLWLFFAWFVVVKLDNLLAGRVMNEAYHVQNRYTVIELPMLILLLILIFNFVRNIVEYHDFFATAEEAISPLGLFLGYVMIKGVFANSKQSDIIDFLDAIVVVHTLAAALYLLHQGLQISIFKQAEYYQRTFRGEEITRTFWFMPVLLPSAILYTLAKKKHSIVTMGILIINGAALFITYTRSLIVITFRLALLMYFIEGLKEKRIGKVLRRYLVLAASAVVFTWVFVTLFPVQTQFFIQRARPLFEGAPTSEKSNRLIVRLYDAQSVLRRVDESDRFLGVGFPNDRQHPEVFWMKRTTADSVWTGAVFHFGVVGAILFLILYLSFASRAYQLYMRTSGSGEYLALAGFLVVVALFFEGFVSWTFMRPDKGFFAFWYFALVAVESNRYRFGGGTAS